MCTCGYVCECFSFLTVMHWCSPQSAESWLSCLSSSRWFWVWAPQWPGTQMRQLRLRRPSGPLGIWWNLASLKEPGQCGQGEIGERREGKGKRGKGVERAKRRVTLVPVISSCKSWLSMFTMLSPQTNKECFYWNCCCTHLLLSHRRKHQVLALYDYLFALCITEETRE